MSMKVSRDRSGRGRSVPVVGGTFCRLWALGRKMKLRKSAITDFSCFCFPATMLCVALLYHPHPPQQIVISEIISKKTFIFPFKLYSTYLSQQSLRTLASTLSAPVLKYYHQDRLDSDGKDQTFNTCKSTKASFYYTISPSRPIWVPIPAFFKDKPWCRNTSQVKPYLPYLLLVIVFHHRNRNLNKDRNWCQNNRVLLWQTWLCFKEDYGRTLELRARKAIEHWGLSAKLCRKLEDKNVESNVRLGLWSFRRKQRLPRTLCMKNLLSWNCQLAVIDKRPSPVK